MSNFTKGDRVWVMADAKSGMDEGSWRTEERFERNGAWGVLTSASPDSDGDYMVVPDGEALNDFYYVHKSYLRTNEGGIVEKDEAVSDVQPGVWVAYYENDDGFSVVTAWASEIDALRYAVQNSAGVKYLAYGEELVP